MRLVFAIATIACAIACGDREHAERQVWEPPSKLETAIARDLGARYGAQPAVHCWTLFGIARRCTATLADRSTLSIRVRDLGRRWAWRVEGLVVNAQPIETYVTGVLADLGAAQAVSCGARVQHIAPGGRVECGLAGGGKAFVTISAAGAMALELALDAGAARARTEVAPDLERSSRALEHTADEDDDEGVATDAGVESAP